MDDVQGDFLRPPHSTIPAAVIANKNIKVSSLESNENTQKQSVGHKSSSVTLNELAKNARRLNCNFVDLSQGSLYQ